MISRLILPFTFAMLAHVSIAQPQLSDDQIADLEQRIADVQARLDLSEEQKEQIRPILEASAEARRHVLEKHGIDVTSTGSGDRERLGFRKMRALRSDMQSVRDETNDQLTSILSDEQLTEWKKIQDEQRAELRQRIQSRRG